VLGIAGLVILAGLPRALCLLAVVLSVVGLALRVRRPLLSLSKGVITVYPPLSARRQIPLERAQRWTLERDSLRIHDGDELLVSVPLDGLAYASRTRLAAAVAGLVRDESVQGSIGSTDGERGVRSRVGSLSLGVLSLSLLSVAAIGLVRQGSFLVEGEAMDALAPIRLDLSGLPDAERDCLSREEVSRYLARVHDRLETGWRGQGIASREGYVSLGFVLDPTGAVRFARVIDGSSPEHRTAGRSVLERSAPFDSISQEHLCLANIELRATLSGGPEL
jgi:hypothetical protein